MSVAVEYYDLQLHQEDDMLDYAQDNSLSLKNFMIIEISDPLKSYHFISKFEFENTEDALLFRLRWPGKP